MLNRSTLITGYLQLSFPLVCATVFLISSNYTPTWTTQRHCEPLTHSHTHTKGDLSFICFELFCPVDGIFVIVRTMWCLSLFRSSMGTQKQKTNMMLHVRSQSCGGNILVIQFPSKLHILEFDLNTYFKTNYEWFSTIERITGIETHQSEVETRSTLSKSNEISILSLWFLPKHKHTDTYTKTVKWINQKPVIQFGISK